LARCEELRLETDGAFDHRPTGGRVALDPAGFVKGWAADEAGAVLAQRDFEHWAINAGGDVLARGGITDAEPWKVGVRHPGQADQVVLVLEAPTLAVATSATYERGEHLWDSRDGSRPAHYRSVTVIGAELAYADAYTKPVWVRGPDGVAWVESQGYEVAIATWDDRLLTTVGVERFRSS
jgi:thiamine biosynthesis lipoprotein